MILQSFILSFFFINDLQNCMNVSVQQEEIVAQQLVHSQARPRESQRSGPIRGALTELNNLQAENAQVNVLIYFLSCLKPRATGLNKSMIDSDQECVT